MIILSQYLLKLSISLAFVYLFYALVLRRLTFYSWNRWYLLGYSLLAFFIPFVNIESLLQKNEWTGNKVIELIPSIDIYAKAIKPIQAPEAATPQMHYWLMIFLLFIAGIAILGCRLLVQYISFRRLRNAATLLSSGKVKVYQVNKPIIPFSFGSSVFINQHQHSDAELEKIIRHEFIHVKQNHTVDILWSELLCMLNWYNPFAWLVRRSIRQNLEFIADNRVISEGADKKQYQYLLLKVVGVPGFSLSQQFNFSSLKKRIAMMNRVRSAKLHLLRFLFILPLIAVMLVSFRDKIDKLLTVRSNSITLQQPADVNVDAGKKVQLEYRSSVSHAVKFNYIIDTTPASKTNPVSRPPADSGAYIIDASQGKSSSDTHVRISPVIRGGDPLFVIDGVVQDPGTAVLKDLDPNFIEQISVFKDANAIAMYGERAKNGVIVILTKPFAKKYNRDIDTALTHPEGLLQNLNGFTGLIIIDDIDFSVEEFKKMQLPADSIEAIFVYKADVAQQRWGKKAANGVIKIVTKSYHAHQVTGVDQHGPQYHEYSDAERAAIEQEAQKNNILYIGVENKIVLPGDPKNIDIETDDEVLFHSDSYFINPKKPGELHIKFFKIQPDGSKKLLENRKYTVKYYPPSSL